MLPGVASPSICLRLFQRFLARTDGEHDVSSSRIISGRAGLLRSSLRTATICTPAGKVACNFSKPLADHVWDCGWQSRAIPARPRGGFRSWASRRERRRKETESAPRRRTDRRPSSRPRDRRCPASGWPPERRRARSRAREQSEGIAKFDAACTNARLTAPAKKYADQREEICLASLGARQAAEELLAVLDADGIQEEREPQRSYHRRRDSTSARTSRRRARQTAPPPRRAKIP